MPAWACQFADREAPPIVEVPERFDLGACHSAEVAYQFDLTANPAPLSPSQRELAGAMNRDWATFARWQNPNGNGVPPWDQFDGGDMVLSLDDGDGDGGIVPVSHSEDHRLAFWESLS